MNDAEVKMKIARIALVILLSIMLVSGLACPGPNCNGPTSAVNSIEEAYAAQTAFLYNLAAQSAILAAIAIVTYYLTQAPSNTQCNAYAEDYEVNNQPLAEGDMDKVHCFIIEDNLARTGPNPGSEPLWEMQPDTINGLAEFVWMVLAEDGTVIPVNSNAMLFVNELTK